jgi:transposase
MARAYSLDLRERVVAAVAAGESCRRVAEVFRISVASVVKWSQRYRATGTAAAKPMGGRRGFSLAAERDWLLARLAAAPDLTLRALVAELGERGVATSYGSVWRLVHAADLSFKKNPVRRRAGSPRRRAKA